MRGRHAPQQHLIEGPITSTLLMFALPLMGSNMLQSLNGTVNQFWVSRSLGVTAITAIGNSQSVLFLIQGAIMGVTMAANILVAQAMGSSDTTLVKRIMGTATTFFFVLSTSLSFLGSVIAPHILTLIHIPAAARPEAIIYLRIMFAAMPFNYFFMFMQMAQRGAGDSKTPFYFMALAVGIGVILNPMLIRGFGPIPKLGIAGSALSTFFGQGVSFMLLLAHLYRKRSVLVLWPSELHLLKPNMEILRPLVVRGLPMGANMFFMTTAAVVMIRFVNQYGPATSAAYTASSLIWGYVQMPGMAIGASVSSMAAQNIGADRWDRVEKIAHSGLITSMVVTAAIAVLIYALGPLPLYLFLPPNSPTVPIALHINYMVLWSFIIYNATFALTGIVRATGTVIPPLVILIVAMWIIRVPFAAALTPRFGADAVWWSFPLGTITSSLLTGLYYKFPGLFRFLGWGDWRETRMLNFNGPER
jgi:putative MATE family efflux protein